MIGEAKPRRLAAEGGHDLMSQDLDYCMGCLLHSIFRLVDKSPLIFKGCTCLRKCYFNNYRFSEDLDFTAVRGLTAAEFRRLVEEASTRGSDYWGVDFGAANIMFEEIEDE